MRYLAFAHQDYYPEGGARDFRGAFNEVFEATKCVTDLIEGNPKRLTPTREYESGHVFDTLTCKIVWDYYKGVIQ